MCCGCCVLLQVFCNAVGVLFRRLDYVAALGVGFGINALFFTQRDVIAGYVHSGSGSLSLFATIRAGFGPGRVFRSVVS